MLLTRRTVAPAMVLAAAIMLLGQYASGSDAGDRLLKDFTARLSDAQLEQLDEEKRVEVSISDLPDEMVRRAVELSHSLFWVAINDQKSRPEPSTVKGGALGLMKVQMDPDDDSTVVDCLLIRLTWHDPDLGREGDFTVEGIYAPEPWSLPPVDD